MFRLALIVTVVVVVVLRLWNLDRVPGELYGDIAIVYEYVVDILAGRWPAYFVLSAGPLYHYVIAPLIWLVGLSYFSLKLASVGVSLAVLAALYGLGRELLDRELGLLAAFVAGVSSWLLIFSRLGNSQILVPLLATGALLFAVRLARRGRNADLVVCALISALGLYTYPQSFILPPVMFVTLFCMVWTRTLVRLRHLVLFVSVTLVCAIPFTAIVAQDPANFFTGYIGGKIHPGAGLLPVLSGNILHALLAFHVRGDVVFRSNPSALPHLDPLSGLLFLAGCIFWLRPDFRRWSPLLFVPFFLLQLPSMLVLSFPNEVPSASRTLGVAPIAYLLVATGLLWLLRALRPFRPLDLLAALALSAAILGLNAYRYFDVYVAGLPDHNIPFGRVIADYVDRLPAKTSVYMVGCCWSPGSQPEPNSVRYVTRRPAMLHTIDARDATCGLFENVPRPMVVIWSPELPAPSGTLQRCASIFNSALQSVGDVPVFRAATLGPTP
jgi:4-amino-4-deoxy-L-arabinose transferase-like glycosyltransferase